jgi:hypothetical protein
MIALFIIAFIIWALIPNRKPKRTSHYDANGKLTGSTVEREEEDPHEGDIAVTIFCVLAGACILVPIIGVITALLCHH